ELGVVAFAGECVGLRDAGRRLAVARDAEVLLGTLDSLLVRHPGRLARRPGVKRLREALDTERQAAAARALGDAAMRGEVIDELRAVRQRAAGWRLTGPGGVEAVERDLERLYRQGRKRMRRAARGKGDRARAMHEWRKRVKDLRYAAEMLERRDPGEGRRKRRRRRARQDAASKFIHTLARDTDRLGEALGEEHDLAVLAGRISGKGEHGGSHGPGGERIRLGRRNRRAVLKLIARRRRRLRKRTLRNGARLYGVGPKRFVRRVRRAYERASISRR
ncbi:MAG: domain containing protein, partial [Solirubrobacterales bacterium]|nr:domain containing protein [Solirubrobacterales bacterium]